MALTEKLAAIGNAIRAKTGGTEKLTLDQMPDEIASITTGGGADSINLTGNCDYAFYGNVWNSFINSNTTTNNITSAIGMFSKNDILEIPFDINLKRGASCKSMFMGSKIQTMPKLIGAIGNTAEIFKNCYDVRTITKPELSSSYLSSNTFAIPCNSMFDGCNCLRELPMDYINVLNFNITSLTRTECFYYEAFAACYALNKIENIPVYTKSTINSNSFYNTFNSCARINKLTFAGPYNAKWTNQVIDLSHYVGYIDHAGSIVNYNTGITSAKQVITNADYQALKDDPDWFTTDIAYSRYNKTSAIETINSLPNTSAVDGANTIKFKGESGSATDGGAINTMSEEQIAVATAKGWTVSYV